MAQIKKSSSNFEKSAALYDNKGNRKGVVSKRKSSDDPKKTRYGVAIDNMGSPYRGVSDNEISTPVGTLDYGYDGDTVYAGVTPNAYAGYENNPNERGTYIGLNNTQAGTYATPNGNAGVYVDRNGRNLFDAGLWGNEGSRSLGVSVPAPVNNNYYGEIDTPAGMIGYGAADGSVFGDFTPNQYIQALINLLRRR